MTTFQTILDVVFLQQYQTRVVVIGASMLGAASGLVGSFLLLRRRALLADTLSHATLPGVAGAFIITTQLGSTTKSLFVLLIGAAIASVIAGGAVTALAKFTRLKQDAILAIVLSVSFGFGEVLRSIVQKLPGGSAAGLEGFIFGKTATMTRGDAELIAISSALILLVCLALFKEFRLLCFDSDFARGQGWPVAMLDLLLMTLVILVTVDGLQAVGLILIIALLVIPPAAARFWTNQLRTMVALSTLFGALSAWLGASLSGVFSSLPSGATIVLVSAGIFAISLVAGSANGIAARWLRQTSARNVVRSQLGVAQ
jgi:manganese/zinc/iron transport system permease protein